MQCRTVPSSSFNFLSYKSTHIHTWKDKESKGIILSHEFTWWIRTVEGVIPGTVFTSIIKTYKYGKLSRNKMTISDWNTILVWEDKWLFSFQLVNNDILLRIDSCNKLPCTWTRISIPAYQHISIKWLTTEVNYRNTAISKPSMW